ncbi:MAG: diguanylate cyclase [Hyphomicrobiales bacterium]|nr:diguanylate cyclase [Hyphomicrobiales bacterium]
MRIVLVDPSRTALKYVSQLLEARDHEVRAFTDGQEALACTKSDSAVGALITSSELGSMSGVELCWEARLLANPQRPIYVILMSSSQDRQLLIEALDCGADDFIGKPPVAEELYARLRAAERLTAMQRELVQLATSDSLTGTLNRRTFFEQGNEALERAAAGGNLFAVMFDIDRFKSINDIYGHDVGDRAIRAVSQAAESEGAPLGRLGGDEFAFLIEGGTILEAEAIAERLRAKVAGLRFQTPKGTMSLSCSIGLSQWEPGDSIDWLLKRADIALYAAKHGGRNRVVTADPGFSATDDSALHNLASIRQR